MSLVLKGALANTAIDLQQKCSQPGQGHSSAGEDGHVAPSSHPSSHQSSGKIKDTRHLSFRLLDSPFLV